MHLSTLDQWLAYIASIHMKEIDLGLTRVKEVAQRLELIQPSCPVIIVGGTNGKGSTVAGLEAIYLAQKYKTGCFTTPYLYRHNEQVRINGKDAADEEFISAFEKVETARKEISLTTFEFNTLAALLIFKKHHLDVWILEVGLGGRLDAVNIIDADVAIVTNISLDHMAILGDTREKIAFEKAGIFRANKPAIYGEANPPQSLIEHAKKLGTHLYCQTKDFSYEELEEWSWFTASVQYTGLPRNALYTENMSTVLMAVTLLQKKLPVTFETIKKALSNLTLPGRMQIKAGSVTEIFDVAHNEASIALLAKRLRNMPCTGKTIAVFSMLADKEIGKSIEVIKDVIDEWYIAPLDVPRGANLENLKTIFETEKISNVHYQNSILAAYELAKSKLKAGDRLITFGSFYTLAATYPRHPRA